MSANLNRQDATMALGLVALVMFSAVAGFALANALHKTKSPPGWQPATEGERLYGRPMVKVANGTLECRYWNWEHPLKDDRMTVEECRNAGK